MMKYKIYIAALLTALIAFFSACVHSPQIIPFEEENEGPPLWMTPGVNQITNGNFSEKGKDWAFYFAGGNATATYGEDRVEVLIASAGNVNYGVQYYYDGFRLYRDGRYTFKFKAKASTPKGCEFRLQLNGGDYHAYVIDTVTLTPEMQEYTVQFTMEEDSDVTPRLAFNMGKFDDRDTELPVTVTISDVSLVLENNIIPDEKKAAVVRTNQIGYRPQDKKISYVKVEKNGLKFHVLDESGTVVFTGKLQEAIRDEKAREYTARADFSRFTRPGVYTLEVEGNRSYPFTIADTVYDDLMYASCRFFYLQRCGYTVEDPVFGHEKCHIGKTRIVGTNDYAEADGGWHDAGDYGRYTVTGAKAAADLMLAWATSKDNYGGYDLLGEARWELDWMLKMQRQDGAVYHKITCEDFPPFEMPQFETDPLFISPVSTPATGDFAGVMAMASCYYRDRDPEFAKTALAAAQKAWAYLDSHNLESFTNPNMIKTGEYGDSSDEDERYFAALALFAATGDQKYVAKAKALRNDRWNEEFGWKQMEGYGDEIVLQYADQIEDKAFVNEVKTAILDRVAEYLLLAKKSGYNLAIEKFVWGSNMEVLDKAHLFMLAADITGKDVYREEARAHFDYILGDNPLGMCFVTGFGTVSPQQPHHRPSIAMGQPMKGMLVGGPDEQMEDSFAQNFLEGKPAMLCYMDHPQSFSTNEIAINWNSSLVYCLAKLIY